MNSFFKFIILVFFLSVNAYAEEVLTVNGLLEKGFTIKKEESIENKDNLAVLKILTLTKNNTYVICSMKISRSYAPTIPYCMKP